MKKRNQISNEYKWDLSKFCKDDATWYEQTNSLKAFVPKLASYKGSLHNRQSLYDFFQLEEEYYLTASKLSMYASNHASCDLSNSKYVEMENLLSGMETELSKATSFFSPEMLSYPSEYLQSLIADPLFKDHAFGLTKLLRSKAHVLSENEERILNASASFAGEFDKIFHVLTDANMRFANIKDQNGKELPLNISNYSVYLNSKDRILRKNAFTEIYKQFHNFADTITANYIASLKVDWFYAETSKFSSVLELHLFPDNISKCVYETLLKNVNENLPKLHTFYKYKAKLLGLKDFSYYDMYVTPSKLQKKIPFHQGMELIKRALSVLGDDYVQLLNRSVQERWMDVYPNQGKRSGAYQSDCYGVTPIVLLNYKDLIDDVFTTAHELGHAMHSYYSGQNQPLPTAHYTIFLAEVASTVNEVLLLKYLYSHANSKQEKLYYLDLYLQMFKGTIFRQTMFSEFEDAAHKLVETNAPISKDVLKQLYEGLNKKYQGKAVKHQIAIANEWLRIPHFYTPYYVYKYATGLVSAICIASNIFNGKVGAVQNYKRYLSSGGSNFSVETLKVAGVNLETSEPYQIAFAEMQWALNELKTLM